MNDSEESPVGHTEKNHEIKKPNNKDHFVCRNDVRNLIKQVNFWREESQKELLKIIDFHNITINKSITDLVEEVCDLQTQLSDTQKERDALRETVEALKCDIIKLGTEFTAPVNGLLGKEICNPGERDAYGLQDDESIQDKTDYKEEELDDGKAVYQNEIAQQHEETLSQQSENVEEDPTCPFMSDTSRDGSLQNGDLDKANAEKANTLKMEQVEMMEADDKNLLGESHVCKVCGDSFTEEKSMDMHLVDVHIIGPKKSAKPRIKRPVGRPRIHEVSQGSGRTNGRPRKHEDGRTLRYCAVRGCSPGRPPAVTYHCLPKKHNRKRDEWIAACRITHLQIEADPKLKVCSKHFYPQDFNDSNAVRRRLRPGAVPSRNLPMEEMGFAIDRVTPMPPAMSVEDSLQE